MESIKISRDSWHYKLTKMSGDYDPQDICEYRSRVFWGMFFVACIVVLVWLVANCVVLTVLGIYFFSLYGFDILTDNTKLALSVVFGLLLTGSFVILCVYLEDKGRNQNSTWGGCRLNV